MLIRDSPESQGYLPDGDIPETLDRPESYENSSPAKRIATDQLEYTTGQALRSRSFWIASTLLGILFFGTSGLQVHQVPYFESIGFSTTEAAATVSLVFALSGVGRIGAGFLADYLDIRYILAGMVGCHMVAWAYLAIVDVNT